MLEVSQVGPAEYPLIRVLQQSIFGQVAGDDLFGGIPQDPLTLMGHLEGNPVGFLVGAGNAEHTEYLVLGFGMLPDYRGQGLGTRMIHWAAQHAEARRYASLVLRCATPDAAVEAIARKFGLARVDDGLSFRRDLLHRP